MKQCPECLYLLPVPFEPFWYVRLIEKFGLRFWPFTIGTLLLSWLVFMIGPGLNIQSNWFWTGILVWGVFQAFFLLTGLVQYYVIGREIIVFLVDGLCHVHSVSSEMTAELDEHFYEHQFEYRGKQVTGPIYQTRHFGGWFRQARIHWNGFCVSPWEVEHERRGHVKLVYHHPGLGPDLPNKSITITLGREEAIRFVTNFASAEEFRSMYRRRAREQAMLAYYEVLLKRLMILQRKALRSKSVQRSPVGQELRQYIEVLIARAPYVPEHYTRNLGEEAEDFELDLHDHRQQQPSKTKRGIHVL